MPKVIRGYKKLDAELVEQIRQFVIAYHEERKREQEEQERADFESKCGETIKISPDLVYEKLQQIRADATGENTARDIEMLSGFIKQYTKHLTKTNCRKEARYREMFTLVTYFFSPDKPNMSATAKITKVSNGTQVKTDIKNGIANLCKYNSFRLFGLLSCNYEL